MHGLTGSLRGGRPPVCRARLHKEGTVAVKTSLTSFMDFTSVVGLRRARVPAQLRAMYEDPTRHPWDYYGPMIEAIKSGLGGRNMQSG